MRRLLFEQLCEEGSGTAASFATRLPITRQTITKHLVTLEQAGLVTVHGLVGRAEVYATAGVVADRHDQIRTIEAQWDHRLAALQSYLLEKPSPPSAQEKEELERWFVQKAEGNVRPGGAMRFEWAPDMVEKGQILEIEPSHRYSYTWEAFSPSPVTIIFELSAENGGTRLHFIQTGIDEGESWGNYYTGMNHG